MPRALVVQLNDTQPAALVEARDHHPKPYIREQAAAIWRMAAGQSRRAVARTGILKPRRQETVSMCVGRFVDTGIRRLLVRKGRGRTAACSPSGRNRSSR